MQDILVLGVVLAHVVGQDLIPLLLAAPPGLDLALAVVGTAAKVALVLSAAPAVGPRDVAVDDLVLVAPAVEVPLLRVRLVVPLLGGEAGAGFVPVVDDVDAGEFGAGGDDVAVIAFVVVVMMVVVMVVARGIGRVGMVMVPVCCVQQQVGLDVGHCHDAHGICADEGEESKDMHPALCQLGDEESCR